MSYWTVSWRPPLSPVQTRVFRTEVEFANENSIPVFQTLAELQDWLEKGGTK